MNAHSSIRICYLMILAVLVCAPVPLVRADPVCEATGIGNCYYIDPVDGDDENDGSFTTPWKSFRNVITYYKSAYRPAGWLTLQPGDCLYLMDGTYSEIIYPGAWKIPPEEGGGRRTHSTFLPDTRRQRTTVLYQGLSWPRSGIRSSIQRNRH